MPPLTVPPPPPPSSTLPPPKTGHDGSIAGVIATMLPIVLLFAGLVWIAKPWRRSKLPRARAAFRDSEDEKRDNEPS